MKAATAGLAVFVLAVMAAGPASRHGAEIMTVVRGVLSGLLVALAAGVVMLTCYAVSARPVIRQHYGSPDDDLLPPPAETEPGWVRVASAHPPAPPVPLPGQAGPEVIRHLRRAR